MRLPYLCVGGFLVRRFLFKMVVDSEETPCRPGSMMFQGERHQVTSVTGKRLLTKTRQRSGCLYEFKVQLNGCVLTNLAEWVDEDDLKDGFEIIEKFGTTTTTTTTICARYIM